MRNAAKPPSPAVESHRPHNRSLFSRRDPLRRHPPGECGRAGSGRADFARSTSAVRAALPSRLELAGQCNDPAADRRRGTVAASLAVRGCLRHDHVATRSQARHDERAGVPAHARAPETSSARHRAVAQRSCEALVVRAPAHRQPCAWSHQREGAHGRSRDEGLPPLNPRRCVARRLQLKRRWVSSRPSATRHSTASPARATIASASSSAAKAERT